MHTEGKCGSVEGKCEGRIGSQSLLSPFRFGSGALIFGFETLIFGFGFWVQRDEG